MASSGPVRPDHGWRARVTEADIRAARTTWWDARQRGDSPERVTELWRELVRLFRAEAEEIALELWERANTHHDAVPRQRGGSVPD